MTLTLSTEMVRLAEDGAMFKIARFESKRYTVDGQLWRINQLWIVVELAPGNVFCKKPEPGRAPQHDCPFTTREEWGVPEN
jgi:hypothetical protein